MYIYSLLPSLHSTIIYHLKFKNMKRLLVTICALALVFVCKESVAQQKQMKKQVKMNKVVRMDKMSYPYTAGYSSDFTIGNPADAKKILELWKDFDNNTFDAHDYFADTAVMYFPDGTMAKGKDSILAGATQFRSSMSSVTSTLDAWVPLKSVDRNENWVAVWGTETDTSPDGKVEKRDIHEIWRFNKDGKVDFMKQFAAKPQMMQ
jgi:hypothetical protein